MLSTLHATCTSLSKVVMTMSEIMDHRREELEKIVEQKAELEEMWNKEKEKWKLLHTVRGLVWWSTR